MRGLKTTAARARNVDAPGINFRTRQQVINGAHPVPDFPAREVSAHEISHVAQHRVLRADQVVATLFGFRVPELASLSLSHRVPADHHVTALD